ncbi:28749_t:CDS:2 [Gigaspora margarita]|uniref:28749_t:CDS:1 n=1 Tax=Gigaspora margarita TaxID=4874 RepID=A0ABN7VC80_GIGMA|nr:28749_t:CDS:2 [Gigaspora margarita]
MNKSNDILNNLPLSELHYNTNQLFSEQLLKPLQEQNEIVTSQEIDDSGGPKRDSVWDDFNTGDSLARECAEVPYEIKEIWRDNLAMEEKTIRRRNKTEIKSGSSKIISEEKQRQIDKAILKGWVCAGIPFETIVNPS